MPIIGIIYPCVKHRGSQHPFRVSKHAKNIIQSFWSNPILSRLPNGEYVINYDRHVCPSSDSYLVLKIPYLLLIGYISSIRWWSWSLPHRSVDGESCSGWWWRLLLTLGTKCYFCQRWGVLQQSSELYLDGHLCILYSSVFQVDFNVICHFCVGVFLNVFPQVSFLQVLLLIRQMEHSNTQSVRIFV